MIEEKDYQEIKQRLKEDFKSEFVSVEDCKENTDTINRKLNNDNTRLAVIESYLKIILGALSVIGAGVITIVFEVFKG